MALGGDKCSQVVNKCSKTLTWPHMTQALEDITLLEQSRITDVHKDGPKLAT